MSPEYGVKITGTQKYVFIT